jgi:hypothetical protein
MQSKLLRWIAASMCLSGEALEIVRPKVLVYRDCRILRAKTVLRQ